jgi:hypothetical protein
MFLCNDGVFKTRETSAMLSGSGSRALRGNPLSGVTESLEYKRDYRDVTIQLEPGRYEASWFDPLTGEWIPAGTAEGPAWKLPKPPVWHDTAMRLKRGP